MKIVNCKLKIIKAIGLLAIVLLLVTVISPPAYAANCGASVDNPATPENDTQPCVGGLVPCTGINCSLCDLFALAQNIFNFVVWTLVPIIGTGMILWSGFTILTAGEKPDQVKKGRKMITATLIGIAIVYSSYIMASFVVKFLAGNGTASSSFKNGQFDIQCTSEAIRDVTGKYLKNGSYTFDIKDEILLAEEEPAPEVVSGQEEAFDLGKTEGVILNIKTKPGVNLDGVDSQVINQLSAAVIDVRTNAAGNPNFILQDLKVASGFRDLGEQLDLVAQNCKDPDAVKCDPKSSKYPITCIPKDTDQNGSVDGKNCRHTTGKALDVWGYNKSGAKCCQNEVIQVMKRNGFCVYKEIWHFELKSNLEKIKTG